MEAAIQLVNVLMCSRRFIEAQHVLVRGPALAHSWKAAANLQDLPCLHMLAPDDITIRIVRKPPQSFWLTWKEE